MVSSLHTTPLCRPSAAADVISVYWALATLSTVGYGDITPQNDFERQFTMFCLLVGTCAFAYIVSEIGTVIATFDRQATLIEERMDAIREWIQWRQLPRDLGVRMRRYYEHYWISQSVFDESASAPPAIEPWASPAAAESEKRPACLHTPRDVPVCAHALCSSRGSQPAAACRGRFDDAEEPHGPSLPME